MQELLLVLQNNSVLIVLWGAVVAQLLLPYPDNLHPTIIWKQFATLVQSKVNHKSSPQQAQLSGALSCLLLLLPALIVFYALFNLAWQPQLLEFALLFFALGWRQQELLFKQTAQWLIHEDKAALRDELNRLLNRDCDTLSLLGLSKASSETFINGYLRSVVTILFWFAIGGGIVAFVVRLNGELARLWSVQCSKTKYFGKTANMLQRVLEYIPIQLFNILLFISSPQALKHISTIYNQARGWKNFPCGVTLAIVGHNYQLSLGGPAIYEGKKVVRAKLGGQIAPTAIHLSQIVHFIRNRLYIYLIFISLLSWGIQGTL